MTYYEHSLISARKFKCNVSDVIHLHKLLDDSKLFLPSWQHRIYSHNTYMVHVIVELMGETIPNTKTGGRLMVRDVLYAHLMEDHNGKIPTPQDWAKTFKFETQETWINRPDPKEIHWLNEQREIKEDKGTT